MKKLAIITFFSIALMVSAAKGQSTEFSYQGHLTISSAPANGNFDLEFALFDGAFGGSQLGSSVSRSSTAVTNGIFSVTLDFGNQFSGGSRFLEIRVRLAGGGGYTTLSPRQPVGSSPYAVRSISASTANTAASATSATTFTGNLAGDVTGTQISTSVDRLRGRPLAATPPNDGQVLKYNSTNGRWEPSTDETGSGGAGGTITGVTAGTGLTGGGTNGAVTVAIATSGVGTSQLSDSSVTTSKIADSSVTDAKIGNVSGGKIAGPITTATIPGANVTGTVANATNFGGNLTGDVTGTQSATTISNNAVTAAKIAGGQIVKSVNSLRDDVTLAAGANISITPSGNTLTIASSGGGNSILNQTTQQAGANFNISGTGNANIVNVATQYNLGGNRILSAPGTTNLFAGSAAGAVNTGDRNAFFGSAAGQANTTGSLNSYFGRLAGSANTSGINNSFFGYGAGEFNTTASINSFFGSAAGAATTTGDGNSFFGASAGSSNISGRFNTSVGFGAGSSNTGGTRNTYIGTSSNASMGELTNATAIGANATVGQNNSMVLGSIAGVNSSTVSTNVGIGTTTPRGALEVKRNWDGSTGLGAITVTGDRPTIKFSSDSAAAANQQWLLHVGGAAGSVPAGSLSFFNGGTGGISFGSPVFAITPANTVVVGTLGAAGSTALCRNAVNEISTCSSSLRYKTNFSSFRSGLDLVKQLRPITFDWTDGGMHDLGLGAEDVAKIEPLLVTYNAKGEVEGVKYDRIGVILVNAVKEQQLQIDRQNELIRLQQAELKALRSFVCSKEAKADFCKIKK